MSEDPLGPAGGANTYAFADNDPINGSDPYGLDGESGVNQRYLPPLGAIPGSPTAASIGPVGCRWHDIACLEDTMWATSGGTGIAGRALVPLASTLLDVSGLSSVDAHSKGAAGGSKIAMAALGADILLAAIPGGGELESASARLLEDAMAGRGARLIAKGHDIRTLPRLLHSYGGTAAEWVKLSGKSFKASTGHQIEVHWYENIATGARYEFKTKLVKPWPWSF